MNYLFFLSPKGAPSQIKIERMMIYMSIMKKKQGKEMGMMSKRYIIILLSNFRLLHIHQKNHEKFTFEFICQHFQFIRKIMYVHRII